MATETVRRCDIYDTKQDVRRFRIHVCQVDDGGRGIDDVPVPIDNRMVDLSPKAVRRLVKYIQRGLSRPGVES